MVAVKESLTIPPANFVVMVGYTVDTVLRWDVVAIRDHITMVRKFAVVSIMEVPRIIMFIPGAMEDTLAVVEDRHTIIRLKFAVMLPKKRMVNTSTK